MKTLIPGKLYEILEWRSYYVGTGELDNITRTKDLPAGEVVMFLEQKATTTRTLSDDPVRRVSFLGPEGEVLWDNVYNMDRYETYFKRIG